jgi:sugar transferase (PEP-CTERM/EpsH1 system associated)
MRIAYLTSRLPYPPTSGGQIRSYHFLRHLARRHQVAMYSIATPVPNGRKSELPRLTGLEENLFPISQLGYAGNALKGIFSDLPLQAGLFAARQLARRLARDAEQGRIDVLIVHLVRMAEYAKPFRGLPRILDMTDSLHLHYSRMPRLSLHPYGLAARVERGRLARYEREATSWFDGVVLASPVDIAWLREQGAESNFLLIPTGIDAEAFPFYEGSFDPHRIVFVGKLDYLPNADAAVYFARKILPLIQREVPQAEFVVVGWNPPKAVRELARGPHVRVLANVPDVRPEVTQAAVSVAPMRFGAGIQVKILESLALGTPAVTTESVAGAFGEEGRNAILVGRDPGEFAQHVASILRDRAYREQLRRAGRKLIERRFQWDQVLAPLDSLLERLSETALHHARGIDSV